MLLVRNKLIRGTRMWRRYFYVWGGRIRPECSLYRGPVCIYVRFQQLATNIPGVHADSATDETRRSFDGAYGARASDQRGTVRYRQETGR